jgi:hypothetical protein
LLFIPREIYTITGSNHFITFKYKNIKNDAINSYEEYGSELGYYSEPQCVLKSSDNPRAIRKASASEKLRLIDERNKAGYIWNGEELERIKPKLSLFGYDVEVTSDIVKIGCKVYDTDIFEHIYKVSKMLFDTDMITVNKDSFIYTLGDNEYSTSMNKIKEIVDEINKQKNA